MAREGGTRPTTNVLFSKNFSNRDFSNPVLPLPLGRIRAIGGVGRRESIDRIEFWIRLKTNRWNRGWFDDQCPLVLEWIWLSEWITIHFEMYVGLKYQRGKLQFGKIIFRQFFRNSISIEKRIRNWKFTERERSIYLSDLIIHERGWRVRVCRTVLKKVPPFL